MSALRGSLLVVQVKWIISKQLAQTAARDYSNALWRQASEEADWPLLGASHSRLTDENSRTLETHSCN